MYYTANPEHDALNYYDALEDAGEAQDDADQREAKRLSDAFVSAAEWGACEPLEKSDMSEALYEISSSQPELIDAFFWRAAMQTSDPVMRAMVREVADAWAGLQAAA